MTSYFKLLLVRYSIPCGQRYPNGYNLGREKCFLRVAAKIEDMEVIKISSRNPLVSVVVQKAALQLFSDLGKSEQST